MTHTRIGILGSSGRMGQQLIQALQSVPFRDLVLQSQATSKTPNDEKLFASTDVWIDFSRPEALLRFLEAGHLFETPVVTGTTGWSHSQWDELLEHSRSRPIFFSANFSVGIHLLRMMLRDHSKVLASHGFSVSIEETHHTKKIDEPSGTALMLLEEIRSAYPMNEIQVKSIRTGDVIGDHEVRFRAEHETLTLAHHASDRVLFAAGALRVARWFSSAKLSSGRLYSMDDFVESQERA